MLNAAQRSKIPGVLIDAMAKLLAEQSPPVPVRAPPPAPVTAVADAPADTVLAPLVPAAAVPAVLQALNEVQELAPPHGTALHVAAKSGSVTALRTFVDQFRVPVDYPNAATMTPLMLAAYNGRLHAVKFLIARGAAINARNRSGWNAVYGAIHTGNLAIASLLLERGADLNVCDADGWPALFQAIATTADTRVVQWLLQRGQRAFLYYATPSGQTWLTLVKQTSSPRRMNELLHVLFANGAELATPVPANPTAGLPASAAADIARGRASWQRHRTHLRTQLEAAGVGKALIADLLELVMGYC